MLDKLTAAESRYEQLMAEMADPAVQAQGGHHLRPVRADLLAEV